MTRVRDLRLLPIAAGVWAVALVCVLLPAAAPGMVVGLWMAAVALVVLLAVRRGRLIAGALPLLAVALAVSGVVATHVAVDEGDRAAARKLAAQPGRVVEATVTLTTKVRQVGGALWFDGDTARLRGGRDEIPLRVPLTISIEPAQLWDGPALDLGSVVTVRGSAEPGDAGQRSVLVLFAERAEVVRGPPHVLGLMSGLRDGFVHDVVTGLPEPGAGLLPGLAVGDDRGVSEELDAAMKTSSLSHLTAVSGANCALVVGIAFAAAAAMRMPRAMRVMTALATLGGFVLLITPEPSVIRAATMAAIAMLGVLTGRTGAGAAALGGAVVVLLMLDPWLATTYGFALSALATAALLLLAGPLTEGLERWMPRVVALGLSVPLAAQIVCGPILVLLSPQVSAYGVVANMIAAPAAPSATVLGMLACVLQGVPFLAEGLAGLAWVPSAWIAQTALLFARLPAATVPWWGGLLGCLALALAGAALVAVLLRPGRVRAGVRRASLVVLAVVAGVSAGTSALAGVAGPLTAPRDWSIAMCDIGQGDAVLLRSEGATMLVDTGPDPALLDACLTRLGIARLDLLVLTHFDLDHVGGVNAVADRAEAVLHGPVGADGSGWLERAGDTHLIDASVGMSGSLGAARWRVLWPKRDSRAFPEGNDASVVLEIAGGTIPRTLLLGDLGASSQAALRGSGALAGRFDVVKVAHHGSADQDPELYRMARPALALIGVGADNDYGHPADGILAELRSLGTTITRTDQDGLVLVGRSADGAPWAWRERPPPQKAAG